jgi:GTPase
MTNKIFKSGFIGLIGRTNVGKSTLVNKILDKNVVITSNKAQTTRNRISCILNDESFQAIFVDCPGFFKPRDLLAKKLNNIIIDVLNDADVIVVMVDAAKGIGAGDHYVFDKIKTRSQPKFLLLNKMDIITEKEKSLLDQKIKELKNDFNYFEMIISISAKTGNNVDVFLKKLIDKLPEGPRYFPEDVTTDMPQRKMISEVIREKLIRNLFKEIPHSIYVEVENMIKKKTGKGEPLINLEACIYADKKSQKAIIIGKSGAMLKKIGTQARMELEKMLESKVNLQIWVKVTENWTKNESSLAKLGY